MKPIIALECPLAEAALDLLNARAEVVHCRAGEEGVAAIRRTKAQGVIPASLWQFTGEVMDQIPTVQVIGRPGMGVDNVDIDAATERGVVVVNVPDGPTLSTAEHTVSLLLALAKGHRPGARVLANGSSLFVEPMRIELAGKVLGLVGLGRIGSQVTHMCGVGFGMNVIAYDPFVSPERAANLGVTLCPSMSDVLRKADFVSLHLPSTRQTRHLIGAETLALMKPSAYLVNCARGPIIDEVALVEALRSGKIAGAGLDVWDPEPPSPDNPLLSMENVVATPHSAGYTADCMHRIGVGAVGEVLDLLAGRQPANMVNPEVWNSTARRVRIGSASG